MCVHIRVDRHYESLIICDADRISTLTHRTSFSLFNLIFRYYFIYRNIIKFNNNIPNENTMDRSINYVIIDWAQIGLVS